ncbi:MAG: 3-oxoacyl-[acyl-carrier-protein] reductase [Desulfosalsimonadaceae bacterium]
MNRTVVVTGGSRGIGRTLCRAFAEPGVHVCFTFHSGRQAGEETAGAITAAGATALPVRADISDSGEANGFFKQVVETTGRVDVLINNAGIAKDSLIPRMKEADWDSVIATNLKGAFICTRAVSRQMMKQRSGRIINITSVAGVAGNPGQANYSAAKAGMIGLTKTTAKELAGRGITVNAIAPGFIETDMTASFTQSAKDAVVAQIPAGRAGTPEDIAGVALFLASGQAAYITGQVIHVNGGLYT